MIQSVRCWLSERYLRPVGLLGQLWRAATLAAFTWPKATLLVLRAQRQAKRLDWAVYRRHRTTFCVSRSDHPSVAFPPVIPATFGLSISLRWLDETPDRAILRW